MADVTAHVIVRGRVQRVAYRASLQREALTRDVRGWVRNRPDGSVEAVLQGSPEAVRAVIDWAWAGPRGASVYDVEVTQGGPIEEWTSFEIRE